METEEPHWAQTILYSLAWLISSLLVIVDVLAIREASLDIIAAIRIRQDLNAVQKTNIGFTTEVLDRGLLFFGGVVAVSLAIAIEYYFRLGQKKGDLFARIGRVFGILVGVFVVCLLIQTLI